MLHAFGKRLDSKTLLFVGIFSLLVGLPDLAASGGPILTVLFDEASGNGRLRVVSRYYEGADRTVVVGTFCAPNGEVASFSCDSATGECVGSWPSGISLISHALDNSMVGVKVYSGSTLVWTGVVTENGDFLQGSAEAFRGLMAAGAQDNVSSLAYFASFLEEAQILQPDSFGCFAFGDRTNQKISCATAVIGFVGSYAPLFTCATIVSCPIAVGLHAAAVVGLFTSCF